MGPLTQPMTEEERARVREWMNHTPVDYLSVYETGPMVRYTGEPVIDPLPIDWLKINEEFS